MFYLYLVLFLAVTAVHLYFSKRNNQYGRASTKGMILLLLLGLYLEGVDNYQIIFVVALLFSWLGDLFLLGKGVKWFTIGGVAFWISHASFIIAYSKWINWDNLHIVFAALIFVLYTVAGSIIFSKLKQYLPKALRFSMCGYLLTNGYMNCFAWWRLISAPSIGALLTALGALLFFVSDSSLFFVRFNKNSVQKSHFLAMLTYSFGELLIVLGMILV